MNFPDEYSGNQKSFSGPFEGAFTGTIEDAKGYDNMDAYRAKKDNPDADPLDNDSVLVLELKPDKAKFPNRLFLWGGKPYEFEPGNFAEHKWARTFRVAGIKVKGNPSLSISQLIGKNVTFVLFASNKTSASGKPYGRIWDVLEHAGNERALENSFKETIGKSSYWRKQLHATSRYNPDNDQMEFPPKEAKEEINSAATGW